MAKCLGTRQVVNLSSRNQAVVNALRLLNLDSRGDLNCISEL